MWAWRRLQPPASVLGHVRRPLRPALRRCRARAWEHARESGRTPTGLAGSAGERRARWKAATDAREGMTRTIKCPAVLNSAGHRPAARSWASGLKRFTTNSVASQAPRFARQFLECWFCSPFGTGSTRRTVRGSPRRRASRPAGDDPFRFVRSKSSPVRLRGAAPRRAPSGFRPKRQTRLRPKKEQRHGADHVAFWVPAKPPSACTPRSRRRAELQRSAALNPKETGVNSKRCSDRTF